MTRARVLALGWAAFLPGGMACMAGHAAHGAAQAPESRAPPSPSAGTGGMPMAACPAAVPGTQISAIDTPEGEAVTFTTSSDRAEELRSRVHAMADMHNRSHQAGAMEGMHGGMHHGGAMGGGSAGSAHGDATSTMPPPSRASAEDVEGGARLIVTPNDPADVERLRSAVRMHAERMRQTGTCDMGHHGHM